MTRWKKICYSEAVRKLFEFYATGNWSLSKLAAWLNDQGFRTRNKRRLKSASGEAKAAPSGQQLSQLARLVQYPIAAEVFEIVLVEAHPAQLETESARKSLTRAVGHP